MKPTFFLFSFFVLFTISVGFCQRSDQLWYFGNHAALDFNSGSPVALHNSQMLAMEGSASISDANGNLLFYTNGNTVWNKHHQPMENGLGNIGDGSATQCCLIEQLPGSDSLYYIFVVADYFTNGDFRYAIVDMSLENGNGKVILLNELISWNINEKLTSVKDAGNQNTWIMVHDRANTFKAYRFSPTGLDTTPVVSAFTDVWGPISRTGYLKFSPDKTKMAAAFTSLNSAINLYDFDAATGVVSNVRTLTTAAGDRQFYGVEFSPSSQVLYACPTFNNRGVYQWDITQLTETGINNSLSFVGTPSSDYAGALQLAPDGKIYIAKIQDTFLAAINFPDQLGTACGFIDNAISVAPGITGIGLPNFGHLSQSTLPVKLLSFTGKKNSGNNLLSWSTASEYNSKYFFVERKTGVGIFTSIDFLPAAGNSSQVRYYSYSDSHPPADINYYRLKQTDIDGKSFYSPVVSINNTQKAARPFSVYPNPATSFIKLSFQQLPARFDIEIVNAIGEIVLKASNRLMVDITPLSKGTYFIKAMAKDTFYKAEFIKQ